MRKITMTMLAICFGIFAVNAQNLITNGDFETGELDPWAGFNNQVTTDDMTNSEVGNVNNGEGSLFQLVDVNPGETYTLDFDYRWVGADVGNYTMIFRIRDEDTGGADGVLEAITLNDTPDEWFNLNHTFTIPEGVTTIRILYYKVNGNRPFRADNVVLTQQTLSVNNLERFDFESYPNPVDNYLSIKASTQIDKIEVYNLLGKRVISESIKANQSQIETSSLSTGMYILKVFVSDNVGTYKLIKK